MKKLKVNNHFNPIIISLNSEKQKDKNFQKEFLLNGVNEDFL